MKALWKNTATLLAGALVLMVAGALLARGALAHARGPAGLAEARKILAEMGGEPGLASRRQKIGEALARLELERVARRADAAAFSQRFEETFAELGLTLTSSSEWKPVPKWKVPGSAAFERTFAGTGPFDRLLDALLTLESWPDQARVRSLSISAGPEAPGTVAFTLDVTAVRLAAKEKK